MRPTLSQRPQPTPRATICTESTRPDKTGSSAGPASGSYTAAATALLLACCCPQNMSTNLGCGLRCPWIDLPRWSRPSLNEHLCPVRIDVTPVGRIRRHACRTTQSRKGGGRWWGISQDPLSLRILLRPNALAATREGAAAPHQGEGGETSRRAAGESWAVLGRGGGLSGRQTRISVMRGGSNGARAVYTERGAKQNKGTLPLHLAVRAWAWAFALKKRQYKKRTRPPCHLTRHGPTPGGMRANVCVRTRRRRPHKGNFIKPALHVFE